MAKQLWASLENPKEVDDQGLLIDVNVQAINKDVSLHEDKRHDIDHFFQSPVEKMVNGKVKKYCICRLCLYVSHTSVTCLLMRTVLAETKRAL
jgi:hypothetical protein